MKKLSLILGVAFLSTSLFAQKGTFYVGGQAGYSSSKTKLESTETGKATSWSFSPEVGTFLTNNIQLGVGFAVAGSTDEVSEVSKTETTQYGGTVYGRYFFGEGSKAFRPFIGANIGVLPGKFERTDLSGATNSTVEADLFELNSNINAGFGYALSPKVTVVGSLGVLGFSTTTAESEGVKEQTDEFGFDVNSLGNRFNIGLYLTL